MKILTLNAHCIPEGDYTDRLRILADMVLAERPDVIGLQEIDQDMAAAAINVEELGRTGYTEPYHLDKDNKGGQPGNTGTGAGMSTGFPHSSTSDTGRLSVHKAACAVQVPVRKGNGAAVLADMLAVEGLGYSWTWLPVKLGYGRYDEGLAFFSRHGISAVDCFRISRTDDYSYWKRRAALGIQVPGLGGAWFYTVHLGWWSDAEEPFAKQWSRLAEGLKSREAGGAVWLMGDMNSPDDVSGEGYDLMMTGGWHDIYRDAAERDEGFTVCGAIDGWRSGEGTGNSNICMRIDYILSKRPARAARCVTVFNGTRYGVLSDHYGVMAELDGTEV